VLGGADLTYAAWEERSNAVARGLLSQGAGVRGSVGLLFDGRRWADFAVAHAGVRKAGAVAVLLSPGVAPRERARALTAAGAVGVVHAPRVAAPPGPWWAAEVDQLERGQNGGPMAGAPQAADRPGGGSDFRLVHAWAPGTPGGEYAMELLRGCGPAATLSVFDPDRFCALVHRLRARICGLTPALAAAVVASGAGQAHDLSSVIRVALSGQPSAGLRAALQGVFPGADVTVLDVDSGDEPRAGDTAPAAVSQEGMLWHEQFVPGSFNLPCLVRRYHGPLDLAALAQALADLIRRHQPLRSTFTLVRGKPEQVVGDHSSKGVPLVDLRHLPVERRDAETAQLLADATTRPFDLSTGPLFDPCVVCLGRDDHLLVVRLHHTVFDDWSVDVFRRELSALYASRLAGTPSPLLEPPTTFVDVCRRERARLAGGRGADQLDWWRRELAGAPLAVQPPIADGTAPEPGEPLRVDLPAALAHDVRASVPRVRATPYMIVLAAFSVLLSRVTAQDDLVIASVVAHRDESDVEPLIGCFTKKVPVRLRLEGDPTFAQHVARTRASLLGSLAHQDVAFDAALQAGLGGRAAAHGVVPQVSVVFQAEAPQRVKLTMPNLTIGPYEVKADARRQRHFSSGPEQAHDGGRPAWGDGLYLGTFLILSLAETPDGIALVARGVFSRPKVHRLLEELQSLLAEAVADPARHVSQLGSGPPPVGDRGDLAWEGFHTSRRRLEAAIRRCPGVTDVTVAVREDGRLVAYLAPGAGPPPTLSDVRRTVWSQLPGAPWPAEAYVVDSLDALADGVPLAEGIDPVATVLTAMWGEIGGRPVEPSTSYWQDFSFLRMLVEARESGLLIGDEHVVRCRTPEMLAASLPPVPATLSDR